MKHWRIMDYYAEGKRKPNLIQSWYESQNPQVQAEFDTILKILEVTKDWSGRKEVSFLKREHKGLFEIIFTVRKIRYRPVGFIHGKNECVLVLGSKKPQLGKYVPANAFDKALAYKKQYVEDGKGSIHEHNF